MKIENIKKTKQNQGAFHNLQSHLSFITKYLYSHQIYTIYECSVKIQHFRHEYSSILCKIRKKNVMKLRGLS